MKFSKIFLLLLAPYFAFCQITLDSIADGTTYTYIASPNGAGPYPAVLYNHGGLGPVIGGDLRATCIALAQAGYFVRAEKRQETTAIVGHLAEVETALDDLRADSRADTSCVTIMGFSRGGLLTLQAAVLHPEKVHAIIMMAPANANGQLDARVTNLISIDDPSLVLVSNNDTFQDQHVILAQMVYDSLIGANKTANIHIYPSYDSNGDMAVTSADDGHELFFSVQEPYWSDIMNFLGANCSVNSIEKTEFLRYESSVFPNPLSTKATLKIYSQNKSDYDLAIFDMLGRRIKNLSTCETEIIISKKDFRSGTYLYIVYEQGILVSRGSFVVD
ncbi:MAG: dienelactone hydrolase family protein [Saprospiraceae bacterium]|nr:dienelactone hydrolase family protein [Saprospiraceae bacterium]